MNSLEVVLQINENVALVRAPKIRGSTPFIFKTNVRSMKHFYHELKLLLTMENYPGITSKPLRVVICNESGIDSSQDTVAGFLSEYYPKGNLRDVLESKSPIASVLQLKWSIQIVETLQHIRASPARFYSDLKPDNLVISGLRRDIIFIDFEQAGNWDTFQPPETFYLTWMEKLSARREWDTLTPGQIFRHEQEQAMVFSLDKVLWCIFEGCSHTRNSIDEEYDREVDHEFPEFRRTSEPLQQLIRKCTYGAPEYNSTEQFHQVRDGPRVNVESSAGSEWSCHGSPREVLEAARTLWSDRLSRMERYVEAKGRWMQNSHQEGDVQLLGFPLRPTLAEALEILKNELRDTVFRA
ncbi:hypothetical protein TRIATDRAFT_306549 [Trichoderma atroviride IMI 206040]|uniref:Protein kinase domain-containing protein n=1 Tax=Hypocrea atroviridis (strain ATCC 20476 / IMI 206040) TaxID=452589 RepID=G9NP69_HYPAI|nr:uncharacterized protein TRIATDRAFT_306549 [Trichoderma atroviride IMI 206040]EHK47854.1 hypothetical protein TRIATDRAFT_306549 [Trichoderma atroviride IMI 206040]